MELERLIEAEQRNDALVQTARDEAERMVRAAKDLVATREAALQRSVEDEIRTRQQALDAEQERRVAVIRAEADAERGRLEAVSEAQIAAVIPELVGVLIAAGGAA